MRTEPFTDQVASPEVERMAQALNDDWAAGPHGARWEHLDPVERNQWREAATVGLRACRTSDPLRALWEQSKAAGLPAILFAVWFGMAVMLVVVLIDGAP